MGFSKTEKGIQVDEQGNIVAVKQDRHVLPGDPEYGNHVPVSTAPVDSPETKALKEAAAADPGLDELVVDDDLLITDEEAQEALNTKSPVGAPQRPESATASNESGGQGGTQTVGVMERLVEERERREAAAQKNAEKAQAEQEKQEQSLSAEQQKRVEATKASKPASE